MATITIDNKFRYFSDGYVLIFSTREPTVEIQNSDLDCCFKLDDVHANVVFSETAVIINMTAGPLADRNVLLSSPVTVGDFARALEEFYSTHLTEKDYAALEDWKYGKVRLEGEEHRNLFKTYGDIQFGYFYEGIIQRTIVNKRGWGPKMLHDTFKYDCTNYKVYDINLCS